MTSRRPHPAGAPGRRQGGVDLVGGGPRQHGQGVVLVQQLHAGVVPERRGHQRHAQEVRQHRVDPRTDEVGEAQRRHPDVGTAPGEGPDVALDVEAVPGEAPRGDPAGLHGLGEDSGVA